MWRLSPGIFLLFFIGCRSIQLTSELNDRDAFRLYRQAVKENDTYLIKYNADSTLALCILNDSSDLVSEPISFFIVNIKGREKILVSINEYYKADWIDTENVRLSSFTGLPDIQRGMNKIPKSNIKTVIFNVTSKQLQQVKLSTEN